MESSLLKYMKYIDVKIGKPKVMISAKSMNMEFLDIKGILAEGENNIAANNRRTDSRQMLRSWSLLFLGSIKSSEYYIYEP
mgnify:CR=1 FL=1